MHWMIHQRWTGPLHRSHMDHHLEQYPPDDLLSEKYRYPAWYHSGPLLFLPGFVVVLLGIDAALWLVGAPGWSLWTFSAVMAVFAGVNDYVHDNMHIRGHWLERFGWFNHWRVVHFQHHFNMRRNFGIVFFGWDRLFGTYKKP